MRNSILCIISLFLFIFYAESHLIPNFLFQLTDSQGNRPYPQYHTGNETQLFFMFSDMYNSFAPVKLGNLLPLHERKIHILLASQDYELIWHLHPEDYEDLSSQVARGPFYVNITFPRSGYYMIAASFLFTNRTFIREGFAQTSFYVWGNPAPNTPVWNNSAQNNFKTYNLESNDVFQESIDATQNYDINGPLVTMEVLSDEMQMRRRVLPPLSADIFSMCTPFILNVYVKDSRKQYVPATLLPFLGAPVHFTLLSDDGYVFHAHGTYLLPNMTFNDLKMEVMGMNMSQMNMTNDEMMNLTMNAMMIGITMNGSLNCFVETGQVIRETGMNMSHFSGPETFGPSIVSIYDFPFAGYWRIFAHMKIKLPDGRIQLIVPHFDLEVSAQGSRITTGMNMPSITTSEPEISTTGAKNDVSSAHIICINARKYIVTRYPFGPLAKLKNHRDFFDWLGRELNYKTLDDWYKITKEDISNHGAAHFLDKYYNSSIALAITRLYPDHKWQIWRFHNVPNGHWTVVENRRKFFLDIAEKIGINKWPDDWYKITDTQIQNIGGVGPLFYYNHSFSKAISSLFPEYKWTIWKFQRVPQNFWDDKNNQIIFLKELGEELGVKTFEDWYKVKQNKIVENGGASFLAQYEYSLANALLSLFPEHPWQFWRFERVSKLHWGNHERVMEYLSWLWKQLEIKNYEDWYSVTYQRLYSLGIGNLLSRHGGLINLLTKYYPQYPWDHSIRSETRLKGQLDLFTLVKQLFAKDEDEIFFDFPYQSPNVEKPFQLDIYIPSLSLAFEYQGDHHYQKVEFLNDLGLQQQRDENKKEICKKEKITLIEIPHWWDHGKGSLIATIRKERPELLTNWITDENPVPLSKPKKPVLIE